VGDVKVTATFRLPSFTKRAADKFIAASQPSRVVRDVGVLIGQSDLEWLVSDLEVVDAEFIGEDDSRFVVEPYEVFSFIVRDMLESNSPIIAGPFCNSTYANRVCDVLNDTYEEG
jgi:hypothetical protein